MAGYTTLGTDKQDWRIGLTTNSTEGAFLARVATLTKPVAVDSTTPTANAVVTPATGNSMCIIPFGTNAGGEAFDIRVYGWNKVLSADDNADTEEGGDLWIPTMLTQYLCTIGTATGVASSAIVATGLFVDTIAATATTGTDNLEEISPTGNIMSAMLVIDMFGAELAQIDFEMDTAESGNVLYRFI